MRDRSHIVTDSVYSIGSGRSMELGRGGAVTKSGSLGDRSPPTESQGAAPVGSEGKAPKTDAI